MNSARPTARNKPYVSAKNTGGPKGPPVVVLWSKRSAKGYLYSIYPHILHNKGDLSLLTESAGAGIYLDIEEENFFFRFFGRFTEFVGKYRSEGFETVAYPDSRIAVIQRIIGRIEVGIGNIRFPLSTFWSK